ncbi:MAG: hypothetical protein Q8P76_00110 [bacterium]|nr:hypothetical protein [bacterium]
MARKQSMQWDVKDEVTVSELLMGAAELSCGVIPLDHFRVEGKCPHCLGRAMLLLINEKDEHLNEAVKAAILKRADYIRANERVWKRALKKERRFSEKSA